jgi:2-oxoisovalerate dehydrogenase E1 component alpha subunit
MMRRATARWGSWKLRGCSTRLRGFLAARGWWDEAQEESWRRACAQEIDAAVQRYLATPKQSSDAMFDYLYAELPPALRAQREDARRYPAGKP